MARMLSRLADRLILCPTTHPIDPENRQRHLVDTSNGQIECWIYSPDDKSSTDDHPVDDSLEVVGIKFPGTGGRAERGGPHPFELWDAKRFRVWTVNPCGYGGSEGEPALHSTMETCQSVFETVARLHSGVPVVLMGNSLGCASALFLAARNEVAGVFLRNPVPLHQMISHRPRYNWWNFGSARFLARAIPSELDAVANAALSKSPAFFVRSANDRVVPAKYQQWVYEQYGGPKQQFVVDDADHHHPIPDSQHSDYIRQVKTLQESWLRG